MDWKRIAASALMLGVLAVPASAASITPQTTMKEIRDDPDIKASGLYTYTYVWERDCEMFSTSRDDETLTEVVGETSAEACAAGLNYLAQVYHDVTRVTQVVDGLGENNLSFSHCSNLSKISGRTWRTAAGPSRGRS